MKLLGMCMILGSCIICGYIYAEKKNERIKTLESFCEMMELMQGELESRLSSLPDMVRELMNRVDGPAAVFLESLNEALHFLGEKGLGDIWVDSCAEAFGFLDEGEKKVFYSLSNVLGKYDVSRQIASLDDCIGQFGQALSREKLDYPQVRKLSLGVSLSAGVLLTIMLV